MRKKKILVKDILNLMEDQDKVVAVFYAYGIQYGDSYRDGMRTAKDCRDQLIYDCLNAQVGRVRSDEEFGVIISAEMVH